MSKACSGNDMQKTIVTFMKDKTGSAAIIFTLMLIPIMGIIGAAVDYSRASYSKTIVQDGLDTAAIVGAVYNALQGREERAIAALQVNTNHVAIV